MPVIDNRGKPIDPDHPFANPCIVFGMKRPDSSPTPSTATKAEIRQPCPAGDENPIPPCGDDTGSKVA